MPEKYRAKGAPPAAGGAKLPVKIEVSDRRHKKYMAFLPNGKKVRVRYPAQPITCARCHQGIRGCRGGGNAAKCEKKGGKQVPLGNTQLQMFTVLASETIKMSGLSFL